MSKKILIVDDEQEICEFLKQIIEVQSDYEVFSALNGEEGFEKFKEHSPDVVVTDVKMPIRDGLWLVDRIREVDKDASVLVMTGFTSVPKKEFEIRNIGEILRKPEDMSKAFEAIEKALKS